MGSNIFMRVLPSQHIFWKIIVVVGFYSSERTGISISTFLSSKRERNWIFCYFDRNSGRSLSLRRKILEEMSNDLKMYFSQTHFGIIIISDGALACSATITTGGSFQWLQLMPEPWLVLGSTISPLRWTSSWFLSWLIAMLVVWSTISPLRWTSSWFLPWFWWSWLSCWCFDLLSRHRGDHHHDYYHDSDNFDDHDCHAGAFFYYLAIEVTQLLLLMKIIYWL